MNKNSTCLERLLQTRKWQVAYQSISPGLVSFHPLELPQDQSAAQPQGTVHLFTLPPLPSLYSLSYTNSPGDEIDSTLGSSGREEL